MVRRDSCSFPPLSCSWQLMRSSENGDALGIAPGIMLPDPPKFVVPLADIGSPTCWRSSLLQEESLDPVRLSLTSKFLQRFLHGKRFSPGRWRRSETLQTWRWRWLDDIRHSSESLLLSEATVIWKTSVFMDLPAAIIHGLLVHVTCINTQFFIMTHGLCDFFIRVLNRNRNLREKSGSFVVTIQECILLMTVLGPAYAQFWKESLFPYSSSANPVLPHSCSEKSRHRAVCFMCCLAQSVSSVFIKSWRTQRNRPTIRRRLRRSLMPNVPCRHLILSHVMRGPLSFTTLCKQPTGARGVSHPCNNIVLVHTGHRLVHEIKFDWDFPFSTYSVTLSCWLPCWYGEGSFDVARESKFPQRAYTNSVLLIKKMVLSKLFLQPEFTQKNVFVISLDVEGLTRNLIMLLKSIFGPRDVESCTCHLWLACRDLSPQLFFVNFFMRYFFSLIAYTCSIYFYVSISVSFQVDV